MNVKRRAGYSLVEVCLALLVAGFGVMAAFALFPEALGQSRKSVEATEIATFADFVFAGLEEKAGSTNTTAWVDFGMVPLSQSQALDSTDPVVIQVGSAGTYQKFWWRPWWYADTKTAYIAKYRLASFTYTLRIDDVLASGKMKEARLEVWAGDIPTPPSWPGKVFYRQFVLLR